MIQSMPIYIACLPNYWNKNNENTARNNIVYYVIIYMTFVKSIEGLSVKNTLCDTGIYRWGCKLFDTLRFCQFLHLQSNLSLFQNQRASQRFQCNQMGFLNYSFDGPRYVHT